MLGVPLDTRVQRTLGVTVESGLGLTLDEDPSVLFPAHIGQPQGDNGLLDGAPRTSLSPHRLYYQGAVGPKLHFCDRITDLDGTVYELISQPRNLQTGRLVFGYSVPIIPAADLYPRAADLFELGGSKALATVECAIYSEREGATGRGVYNDGFAELPPSAWQHIEGKANVELRFGDGSVWKLTDATLAPEAPYVNASAKRAA